MCIDRELLYVSHILQFIRHKFIHFYIIATQVAVVNPEGLNVSTAFPLREQNNGTSVT